MILFIYKTKICFATGIYLLQSHENPMFFNPVISLTVGGSSVLIVAFVPPASVLPLSSCKERLQAPHQSPSENVAVHPSQPLREDDVLLELASAPNCPALYIVFLLSKLH